MELASDFGPLPLQVGAILVSGSGERLAVGEVRDALADRVCAIPRLRQQLVLTRPGCGRPVWVDDPGFDVARHVHQVARSPPGDEDALLRAAAGVVAVPLPPGQPLWSATIVTGPGDACAVIVVFHHVLADGMGGLVRPSTRRLAADAAVSRARVLAHLGRAPARLRDALAELRPGAIARAPCCSLNRPVGTRRRFGVVRADLAQVRSAGRALGGTRAIPARARSRRQPLARLARCARCLADAALPHPRDRELKAAVSAFRRRVRPLPDGPAGAVRQRQSRCGYCRA